MAEDNGALSPIEAADVAAHGEENRRRFLRALNGNGNIPWQWRRLRQIHSALVWEALPREGAAFRLGAQVPTATETPTDAGDGLLSSTPGLLLTIRTADCVPILIADARLRVVAAVHAGWRGTAQRIAQRAVGEMRAQFQSRPEDLRAAIGPSIRGCCYEVGADVRETFFGQFGDAGTLFQEAEPDPISARYPMLFLTGAPPGHPRDPRWNPNCNWRLDLAEANRRQLVAAGLRGEAVEVMPYCTACRSDLFFSYRRDRITGRMAAAIGVAPPPAARGRRRSENA